MNLNNDPFINVLGTPKDAYTQAKKYPDGKQKFDGFCQFEQNLLGSQKCALNID